MGRGFDECADHHDSLAITVSMALLVVAIGMRSTFADTLIVGHIPAGRDSRIETRSRLRRRPTAQLRLHHRRGHSRNDRRQLSAIIQRGVYAIEVLAMVLVPGGIAVATADWPYRVLVGRRPRLARPLHLGREILIAADIVWTVALQAAHLAGAELAILVLIRTSVSRQRTRKKEKV